MTYKQCGSFLAILWIVGLSTPVTAQAIDNSTIQRYQQQLERLDKLNFHPNLLPLILRHKDYLELTPEQLEAFMAWRNTNAKAMFATMNEIIHKRIEFREAALSPEISADDLREMQQDIFALHQKVLDYKLSCRENIHRTFSQKNWEDFFVVLAEEGYAIPDNSDSQEVVGLSDL